MLHEGSSALLTLGRAEGRCELVGAGFIVEFRSAARSVMVSLIVCLFVSPAARAQPTGWKIPDASKPTPSMADYRIGPLDKLNITVFQVKDLTLEKVQVDASGQLLLPLIGVVKAQGKTTTELSADIADRLRKDFLQSPQVSILVDEAASQKVTVDGAVKEAGVFPLKGRTTLLQTIALAKGAERNAKLKQVVVFRVIDGQRQAARFDVEAIRDGRAPDPEIEGEDVVVVPGSKVGPMIHDIVTALPGLAIFRPY
jgi:polysaccharide export outer membrane protein